MQCFRFVEKKETPSCTRLCLDGVLSLREVCLLLLLLLRDDRSLVLGESSTNGAGVLGSEVEGSVPVQLLGSNSEVRIRLRAEFTHFLPL